MSFIFMMPQEVAQVIAQQLQAKRLALNFSQKTLSERAGVSYSVLKKFEQTGKISLLSLLKLALVLGLLEDCSHWFANIKKERPISLDELLKDKTRKRGRK